LLTSTLTGESVEIRLDDLSVAFRHTIVLSLSISAFSSYHGFISQLAIMNHLSYTLAGVINTRASGVKDPGCSILTSNLHYNFPR